MEFIFMPFGHTQSDADYDPPARDLEEIERGVGCRDPTMLDAWGKLKVEGANERIGSKDGQVEVR
jgi:hypothetical protein